jgi:hypothetical protein
MFCFDTKFSVIFTIDLEKIKVSFGAMDTKQTMLIMLEGRLKVINDAYRVQTMFLL